VPAEHHPRLLDRVLERLGRTDLVRSPDDGLRQRPMNGQRTSA